MMDITGPSIILPAAAVSFFVLFIASFDLPVTPTKRTVSAPVVLSQLLNRKVIMVLLLCTLMQASHAPFYTFFSIYLEGYGYSKAHIGWLWTVGVVLEIFIFMAGHRLLYRFNLTHLLTFTFLLLQCVGI